MRLGSMARSGWKESTRLCAGGTFAVQAAYGPDENGWIEPGAVEDPIDPLGLPDERPELVDGAPLPGPFQTQ